MTEPRIVTIKEEHTTIAYARRNHHGGTCICEMAEVKLLQQALEHQHDLVKSSENLPQLAHHVCQTYAAAGKDGAARKEAFEQAKGEYSCNAPDRMFRNNDSDGSLKITLPQCHSFYLQNCRPAVCRLSSP